MQTTTCKRAACGLAVPPYQRANPIYLPSNATDASRGRPPAFFEILARPSTWRASRLRIPNQVTTVMEEVLRFGDEEALDFEAGYWKKRLCC